MGKFCCRANRKPELGILCLNDYVEILKFQGNYNLSDVDMNMKYKAYFYIGVLNCQVGNYA